MTLSLKIFTHIDGQTAFVGEHTLEGERITVGRSPECALKLDDPEKMLSRVHLAFEQRGSGFVLRVLSQHWPVKLNGEEHAAGSTVELKVGDNVVLDKYELELVSFGPEVDLDATVAVARRPSAAPAAPAAPVAPRGGVAMSIPPGLSATRLADLPGATPYQTAMAGRPETVQIASLQPGHVLLGRFRVEEQIGAGGMGAVYRAHDELRGEDIALKVMLPGLLASEQAKQRFMNEAKIAIRLRHPNVVSVHDVQADGPFLFLTMELLRGQTLREAMEQRKGTGRPWSEAEALAVIKPLCEALGYAHQFTVHRDIKPENVWLGDDGAVRVMDFGIARVLSGSQMTQTAAVMGTAYYMAPEQLAGVKDIDHRADQYALAVMLYEMLTARIPAGRVESVKQVRADVSEAVSDAIDRALSGNPQQRFASDAELAAALSATGSAARPQGIVAGAVHVGKRSFVVLFATAGTLAAIILVIVLVAQWRESREKEAEAKQEIARLDGEAKSLLKMIEGDRRELRDAAAAATRDTDRLESQARTARSAQERDTLEKALREARDKAALNADLDRRMRERAEGSNGLPKAEGNLNAAAMAMKEKETQTALELLRSTVGILNGIRSGAVEDRKAAQAAQLKQAEERRKETQQLAEARAKAETEARARAEAERAARPAPQRQAAAAPARPGAGRASAPSGPYQRPFLPIEVSEDVLRALESSDYHACMRRIAIKPVRGTSLQRHDSEKFWWSSDTTKEVRGLGGGFLAYRYSNTHTPSSGSPSRSTTQGVHVGHVLLGSASDSGRTRVTRLDIRGSVCPFRIGSSMQVESDWAYESSDGKSRSITRYVSNCQVTGKVPASSLESRFSGDAYVEDCRTDMNMTFSGGNSSNTSNNSRGYFVENLGVHIGFVAPYNLSERRTFFPPPGYSYRWQTGSSSSQVTVQTWTIDF